MATPAAPPQAERTLAAVAYVLTWVTGVIILLTAKKDDRYTRWHAIQAIGLGIVAFVVSWILNIVWSLFAFATGFGSGFGGYGMMPGFGMMMGAGMFGGLWWLLVLVLIIVCAVKAYQGESLRLPVIADIADRNA